MEPATRLRSRALLVRGCSSLVAITALGLVVTAVRATGPRESRLPVGGGGPRPVAVPATVVEGIYPTADRLPANLLRLYVVFSSPMSMGESRAHVRLLDEAGRPVSRAFLELEEELWDASGRRLTVLFDPGRIKRGLRANLESGPPLVTGRRYRLEIDAGWRDGRGQPLRAGASKTFDVVAADRTVPSVDAWAIDAPAANTRAPLVLRFGEALDRALLSSAIVVEDPAGVPVRGSIEVAPGEESWSLTPERAWAPGHHVLRVSAELEDVAGNNLHRLFDADLSRGRAPHEASDSGEFTRSFIVSAAPQVTSSRGGRAS